MMEAENGSLELAMACILRIWGVNAGVISCASGSLPENDGVDHWDGNAHLGGQEISTLSWQICATHPNCYEMPQIKLEAGARNNGRRRDVEPSHYGIYVFGLAASMAVRLTIWPISLACSPNARICACTYSRCNRMTSLKSLACSRASA